VNEIGTKSNPIQSSTWLLKSAEMGYADAMVQIAHNYYTGSGIEENYGKTFYWYKKATVKKTGEVCRHVAKCYLNGIGNSKNEYKQ
jgi:TPR repeat protein